MQSSVAELWDKLQQEDTLELRVKGGEPAVRKLTRSLSQRRAHLNVKLGPGDREDRFIQTNICTTEDDEKEGYTRVQYKLQYQRSVVARHAKTLPLFEIVGDTNDD